jgi:hypothetical protein
VRLSDPTLAKRLGTEAADIGPFSLVIVDSSAAYFEGADENANVQMGGHARMLRGLTDLPGRPTVIVTCHPPKNADLENLQPRGGGAFIAEVDGNLVCKRRGGSIVDLHSHGKFRGPEFQAIPFKIVSGTSERLRDTKGRLIYTVTARAASKEERQTADDAVERRTSELLKVMQRKPGASLLVLAQELGWTTKSGDFNKTS